MKFLIDIYVLIICFIVQAAFSFETADQQQYNLILLLRNAVTQIKAGREFEEAINSPVGFSERVNISTEILHPLLSDVRSANASKKCIQDVEYFLKNIASPSGWAAKMIDSYGKPESGILLGNIKWLGEFNECINVYAPVKENTSTGNFHGQYCSLNVILHVKNMSVPLSIGTCLPDSCHLSEVQLQQLDPTHWHSSFKLVEEKSALTDTKLLCQPNSKKLTTEAIVMICLIALFVLLAFIGSLITAFTYYCQPNVMYLGCGPGYGGKSSINVESERYSIQEDEILLLAGEDSNKFLRSCINHCKPFFNCFCIFTNGAKILDTSTSEGQLPCLHGIRFLSLCWIIVCHTYGFSFLAIRNIAAIGTLIDNWPFMVILNGFFSVDSFFLLSGFLVAYLFFKESSKPEPNISWISFYIHRYIRLTPVYMVVVGFYATLYSYLGSGPFWVNYDTEPICRKNWWWNLLYINNFQLNTEQCMAWSWYLSNDMQFFVISPIILITLQRWPKVGYSALTTFLAATILSNVIITYKLNLISGLGNLAHIDDIESFMASFMDFFNYLYIRPYTRIGPYLVGITLACYLHRRAENISGRNRLVTLWSGWVFSSGIVLFCLFVIYHQNLTLAESCLYNAFSRIGFSLGVAWVIFACVTGQGGFINSILSFKPFIPLSRLTYCAYLIHPMVITAYFGSLKTSINFSHVTVVLVFFGFLIVSYTAALVASLIFESPVIRLEKYIRMKFCGS